MAKANGLGSGLSGRKLRCFYETVTTGSIRAAAEKLDTEPSVVSRQIQQLEAELGVQLLERRGRGVRPTNAALLVMEHCKDRIASEELLRSELDDVDGLQRGEVRMAAGEGFLRQLVATVVERFCKQHPQVKVSVDLAHSADLVRMVTQDQVHIGLGLNPPPDPVTRTVASRPQPLRLIVWPGHPLTALPEPVPLSTALAHPFAVMSHGFGLRQAVQLAAFAADRELAPSFTSNSVSMLRHYVLAHAGFTFLSASAVAEEIASGDLVALRTDNTVLESAEACLIVRRGRPMSMAVQRLLQLVEETGQFKRRREEADA